jgi:manganese/zinc/iron transport system permease protein
MAISWLLAGTCMMVTSNALIGMLLVPRKRLLLADALGHALFPGLLLGGWLAFTYSSHIMLLLAGLLVSWLAIWGIERIVKKGERRVDAALAAVFSTFFALGLLLSVAMEGKTSINPEEVFFGNIVLIPYQYYQPPFLSVFPVTIWLQSGLLVILFAALAIWGKYFTWQAFSPDSFPVLKPVSVAVSVLASLAILFSFADAGLVFTGGTIIVPAATCWYIARARAKAMTFRQQIVFGLFFSWSGFVLGISLAFGFNLEPAATIVFTLSVQALIVILTHTLLTRRRLLT